MANITTQQVINDVDKECYTLYVEWAESSFKIMIFKPEAQPLTGEMKAENVQYFSKELGKSCVEYIAEAKDAFCRKNKDIQFYITDESFKWMRKNVWTLGQIDVQRVKSTDTLLEILQNIMEVCQNVNAKLDGLEAENKCLIEMKTKLTASLEEVIKYKLIMEEELYKKFLLILNEKKRKYRELKQRVQTVGDKADTVFQASTDEASSDEETEKSTLVPVKNVKPKQRELPENSAENSNETCKTRKRKSDSTNSVVVSAKRLSPIASTSEHSKNQKTNILENSSLTELSRSERIARFLADDSEDDMFD